MFEKLRILLKTHVIKFHILLTRLQLRENIFHFLCVSAFENYLSLYYYYEHLVLDVR
jgi:hypothetical protein